MVGPAAASLPRARQPRARTDPRRLAPPHVRQQAGGAFQLPRHLQPADSGSLAPPHDPRARVYATLMHGLRAVPNSAATEQSRMKEAILSSPDYAQADDSAVMKRFTVRTLGSLPRSLPARAWHAALRIVRG